MTCSHSYKKSNALNCKNWNIFFHVDSTSLQLNHMIWMKQMYEKIWNTPEDTVWKWLTFWYFDKIFCSQEDTIYACRIKSNSINIVSKQMHLSWCSFDLLHSVSCHVFILFAVVTLYYCDSLFTGNCSVSCLSCYCYWLWMSGRYNCVGC